MTTEIKSTQTARIRALNDELRKDFTSWLSDGTPRWLPHELHNWVNSRTRGGVAPAWQRHHHQQQRRRRRKRERK